MEANQLAESHLKGDVLLDDLSFLDQESFRRLYTQAERPWTMDFFVEGVHCTSCLWRIESVQESLPFVKSARLDMSRNVLTLELEEGGSFATVVRALKEMGYPSHPMKSEQANQDPQNQENRRFLTRLGIAGASAGNVMLMSFAVYAGADGSIGRLFEWLSFILFLPILCYAAIPFYKNSWHAIRGRRASIDIPIVAAVLIGTTLSLYHLVLGHGDIYFDSLAVLVFLLLSSRYLLNRLQQQYLSPSYLQPFFAVEKVRKWKCCQKAFTEVPLESIKTGDRILVRHNEKIPVDGQLLSDSIYVNSAILTGEHFPQRLKKGDSCYAGTRLASDSAEIEVQSTGVETRVGQLLTRMESEVLNKTPLISITDKVAQWFTVSVLTLGLVFLAVYWWVDPSEAIRRSLALVILACPCALAFAVPLTQSLSLMKAVKKGYLIKKAEALEKLSQVQAVVFDKTGTLTEGDLSVLRWEPVQPGDELKKVIFSLEKNSTHPVGRALRHDVGEPSSPVSLSDHQENIGRGVQGIYQGQEYMIKGLTDSEAKALSLDGSSTAVGVYRDGQFVTAAVLGDRIRQEAKDVVSSIQKMNIPAYLLSGDRRSPVQFVAQSVSIPADQAFDSVSPEQKQEFIQGRPKTLMVGDGVNDSVAMAASDVSIAVQGSMEASLRAADIYLTRPGVKPVEELLQLSHATLAVIRRNLGFSLVYNIVGGAAALLGWINPLVAAILMPISSATVLLSAVWGTKELRNFSRTELRRDSHQDKQDSNIPQTVPVAGRSS